MLKRHKATIDSDEHAETARTRIAEKRNRVADSLEKLVNAHQSPHGAPTYRVGNRTIETRVAIPVMETRGAP